MRTTKKDLDDQLKKVMNLRPLELKTLEQRPFLLKSDDVMKQPVQGHVGEDKHILTRYEDSERNLITAPSEQRPKVGRNVV